MENLTTRIQALPQELQDSIFDFAIAIKADQTVKIDRTLKAPWFLQINKKLRKELAPIYFGSTILIPFARNSRPWLKDTTKKWFQAQTRPHREMIAKARIHIEEKLPDSLNHDAHNYRNILCEAKLFLSSWRVRGNVVIEMNVRYHDPDDGKFKQAWAGLETIDGLFRCQCTMWEMCLLAY